MSNKNEQKAAAQALRNERLREANMSVHVEFEEMAADKERHRREKEKARLDQVAAKAQQRTEQRERKFRERDARKLNAKMLLEAAAQEQAEKQLEREAHAKDRQRQQMLRDEQERDEAERSRRSVEEARLAARQRVQQEMAEAQQAAALREIESEKRLKAFEENKRTKRERELEVEKQKALKRKQIMEETANNLESHKVEIMHKLVDAEARFTQTGQARKHENETVHEVLHIGNGDKQFFVNRRSNAQEFQKLVAICKILTKKEIAEGVSRQREQLMQATLRDRENLRLEKERAQQLIAKKLHTSVSK